MSAVTIRLTNICSGGGHLTFAVTGDATLTRIMNLDDLTDPLTEQDLRSFLRVIAWLAKNGRTINQARVLLQNGVEVKV